MQTWAPRQEMDEKDFEGTLVLEQLVAIGRVEEFFDAIDSDDVERATRLMRKAKVDARTVAVDTQEDGGERRRAPQTTPPQARPGARSKRAGSGCRGASLPHCFVMIRCVAFSPAA